MGVDIKEAMSSIKEIGGILGRMDRFDYG